MKIERMTDHKTETQRSSSWLEERQAREEKRDTKAESFVVSGIRDYSEALARCTVSPTPIVLIERESLLSGFDEEVAKVLSEVEVVDPHFDNLDVSKPQDLTDATGLTVAKAKALGREINDPKIKKELDRIADKVLRGVGGFLAGRRRALTVTSALALVATACGPLISPESTSLPSPTEPVVTEVAQVPTEPTAIREAPPTPVTIASGRPYPESDVNFFLGAGGLETAEERLRELGAGPDIDKIWAMGIAEMNRAGINPGNVRWVTELNESAENPSWTTMPKDKSTGHFLFPKITSGSEAGQLVRSGSIFAYLDREIGDDFFDWIELQDPEGIGKVEQRLIGDKSGWIVVGAFNAEGEMLFWFNAEKDEWITASDYAPIPSFPNEQMTQLQEQLAQYGTETEIVEDEKGEFILNDINRTKAVEIGVFRLEDNQYVFVVIKSNGEEITYPISQLGIDEEDNRLVIRDETGRINFKYYPELQRLKQEIEFPYLELSTESGRFNLKIGESMEDDIKSIEWNNDIPPLRYQDPETGEIRMLTPQERFDEAVFVAFWSLAKGSGQPVKLSEIREGVKFQFEDNEGNMREIDTGESFHLILTNSSMNGKFYKYCKVSVEKFWLETNDIGKLWIYVNYGGFALDEQYEIDSAELIADFSFFSVLTILSNAEAMKGIDQPARWDYILRGHNNPELLEIIGKLVYEYSEDKHQNKKLYNREGPTGVAKEGPKNNLVGVEMSK
jgi:hypothetical protein